MENDLAELAQSKLHSAESAQSKNIENGPWSIGCSIYLSVNNGTRSVLSIMSLGGKNTRLLVC